MATEFQGLRLFGGEMPAEEMPVEEAPVDQGAAVPVTEETIVGQDASLFDTGMVDKMVARYLEPGSRCGTCIHFTEPGSCQVVAGPISPDGVCMIYTPDAVMPSDQVPVEGEPVVPSEEATVMEEEPTDGSIS